MSDKPRYKVEVKWTDRDPWEEMHLSRIGHGAVRNRFGSVRAAIKAAQNTFGHDESAPWPGECRVVEIMPDRSVKVVKP
jgi:hypothetical protein